MAARCGQCGSSMVQAALDRVVCLICRAETPYSEQEPRGRIANPDGPATYATDPPSYHGDPPREPAPKQKAPTKAR